MAREFPTLRDGDELAPWHLNIIYAELRRWRKFQAAPPLALDSAAGVDSPKLALMADVGCLWVKATSVISAASGATYGTGTALVLGDSGTQLVDGVASVKIKNGIERSFLSGSRLLCVPAYGSLWVATPQKCADMGA